MTWPLIGTDRIHRSAYLFTSQVAGSDWIWSGKRREQESSESTVWLTPEEFSKYPFAKPQQKIWTTFTENEN